MSNHKVSNIKNTSGTTVLSFGSAGSWTIGGTNAGSSGQVLTSQGSGSLPTWTTLTGGGGGPGVVYVYTSSATFTPASGATNWLVFCIGAGGGSSARDNSYGGAGGGSGDVLGVTTIPPKWVLPLP